MELFTRDFFPHLFWIRSISTIAPALPAITFDGLTNLLSLYVLFDIMWLESSAKKTGYCSFLHQSGRTPLSLSLLREKRPALGLIRINKSTARNGGLPVPYISLWFCWFTTFPPSYYYAWHRSWQLEFQAVALLIFWEREDKETQRRGGENRATLFFLPLFCFFPEHSIKGWVWPGEGENQVHVRRLRDELAQLFFLLPLKIMTALLIFFCSYVWWQIRRGFTGSLETLPLGFFDAPTAFTSLYVKWDQYRISLSAVWG